MEIEQAVYGKLSNTPDVVGTLGTRVYPGQAPEGGEMPYAVYHRASQQYMMALARRLATNRYTMHIDVWGEDYASTERAYHAIRDALAGFRGTLGGDQVTVLGVFDEGGDGGAEPPVHAEESGLYRAGIDLTLVYQRGA